MTGIPAVGIVAAITSAWLPSAIVAGRARRRLAQARRAWPDLVDHLVAGIRSGLPLAEALVSLAEIGPEATRRGFRRFDRALRARGSLDDGLSALCEELADPVADRVAASIRVARDVGGTQLPGILRGLSRALRQEAAARGEAEARQSWVVAAARLGVAAPWAVLLVLSTRPEVASVYASPGGSVLVLAGFVVTVVAYRLMLGLGRLPEERRWLT